METMIGGVIVALGLGIVLTQVAMARSDISLGSRHATAASLARMKADELISQTTMAATTQEPIAVDAVTYPGIIWQWSVAADAAVRAASVPTIIDQLWLVEVTMTFPIAQGNDTLTYRTYKKD
jgi:hypothetical protein